VIRLRTGTVRRTRQVHPGLVEALVEVEGREERALAYPALCGPVAEGAAVVLNTTAVALGLGTGGYHFVIAVEGQHDVDPPPGGHVMKLRYTPLQATVQAATQQGSPHRGSVPEALEGLPVVWLALHSMLGVAAAGAMAAGASRVAYVMTDGAALPAALSRQVQRLREAGLLQAVVILVGDGPGKVGTGTRWGASDVGSGMSLNATGVLGGRPVAALRVSFAEPGYRHQGVSPHSLTVLREVALLPVNVAVPALEDEERRAQVWDALRGAALEERHQLVEVTGGPALAVLRERGVDAETMGRSIDEDPVFFEAAGAAGVLAGRMAAGSTRWRRETEAAP
jgi:hypothetical protein